MAFRIFGLPMHSWRVQMPSDMFLKSEGFASNLYAPEAFSLERFCAERSLSYRYMGRPVPRKIFVSYGLAFQQHFVSNLEEKRVLALKGSPIGWQLFLDTGEMAVAREVVIAVGLSHFKYVPPVLASLPPKFLSHSCDHSDLSLFRGCDVTVVGGGASACDVAASLHRSGAQVRLIARGPTLRWTKPDQEPLWGRLFYPPGLGVGGGWRSRFLENCQLLFRRLPQEKRLRIARTYLGPRAGWPVRDIIERLPPLLEHKVQSAEVHNYRVRLVLTGNDGNQREVLTDHIVAATGFQIDLRKLIFLDGAVRSAIKTVENTPILSDNFECSVPGIYFTGLAAASTFGPSMRFLIGARFAARTLTRHFTRTVVVR